MRGTAQFRGDPVELRPNVHPTMPKIVVRDAAGHVIEDTHFDAEHGIVIALDELPTVGQIAIVPPRGTTSLILPARRA